ncbi:MAG: glycan biosynthesis hexose transferase WsfD [Usitatibacter sp.]
MPALTMTSPARRYSFLGIVAITLLALALVRAMLLVTHEPVLGYGDQSDMHRTFDCVGIEPIAESSGPANVARPYALYHTSGFKGSGCYPSSAALIAVPVVIAYGIASIASDDPEILIPVQAFGAFNLALFTLLALAGAMALRPYPVASLVHAAIVFLLIADPVSTLWFNTLYAEPAALLGTYGAITMAGAIMLGRGEARWPWWLLGVSLVTLGLAREQFAYLPLALAAIAWPALRLRSPRKARVLLVVAAIVAAAQVVMGPLRPDYVSPIQRVNAYLGVILASSADEPQTLAHLGLPGRCAAMTGATWMLRHGEALETACPEVTRLSSFAFLKLFATEPMTLLRAASRVLPAAGSFVPASLGVSSGGPIRAVSDLPPRAMSFVALLAKVPAMVFAWLVVTLLIAFPFILLWLLWTVRREPELLALPTTFAMLVAVAGYILATTAFGSGIPDAERHNWLGALATLAALGLIPLVAWHLSRDILGARIAMAAMVGVLLLSGGWLIWTRHAPLAIGALDKMVEERGRSLAVSGWALDPWGVKRVYATVGGGPQAEGTSTIERRDLEAGYPGYPEAASGGFQITLPSHAWRENEQMRIFVENRVGAVTEIDRRQVRLHP